MTSGISRTYLEHGTPNREQVRETRNTGKARSLFQKAEQCFREHKLTTASNFMLSIFGSGTNASSGNRWQEDCWLAGVMPTYLCVLLIRSCGRSLAE